MPEMDGPTLLDTVRKTGNQVPFIFASGYAEDAFEKNLPESEHGKFGFIPKPYSLKQLATAVKEQLDGEAGPRGDLMDWFESDLKLGSDRKIFDWMKKGARSFDLAPFLISKPSLSLKRNGVATNRFSSACHHPVSRQLPPEFPALVLR